MAPVVGTLCRGIGTDWVLQDGTERTPSMVDFPVLFKDLHPAARGWYADEGAMAGRCGEVLFQLQLEAAGSF